MVHLRIPILDPRPEVPVVQGPGHWEALETCSLPGVSCQEQPLSRLPGSSLRGLKILLAVEAQGQRD